MGKPSRQQLEALSRAVLCVLPGWRLASGPEPFGWALDRHLRARLERDGSELPIVIRQSYGSTGHKVETHLYRSVLPSLSIRTAELLAVFALEDCDLPWMVLEDLGTWCADTGNTEHRAAVLRALGALHAESSRLLIDDPSTCDLLPRFAVRDPAHEQWRGLIADALGAPESGIEPSATLLLEAVLHRLTEQPAILVHGDLDFTNAIPTDQGMALIDWEKASIGPPSLDLGAMIETLSSRDELATYRDVFNEAGGEKLTREQLQEWTDLGDAYDCFHWICYCLRVSAEGHDPGESWRESYYGPRLRRLSALTERRGNSAGLAS